MCAKFRDLHGTPMELAMDGWAIPDKRDRRILEALEGHPIITMPDWAHPLADSDYPELRVGDEIWWCVNLPTGDDRKQLVTMTATIVSKTWMAGRSWNGETVRGYWLYTYEVTIRT